MNQVLTSTHFENLELQIRKEQEPIKRELKPQMMQGLRDIVENCFRQPKSKKENFISREKIVLDFLKLLQSQKKFKQSENIYANIRYLAAFDESTNEIGRIINLNLEAQTVEYQTWSDRLNNRPNHISKFADVKLFDFNSMAMEIMHTDYKKNHSTNGLSYLEMYNFLSQKDCNPKTEATFEKGYGVELQHAFDSPVIKAVIEEYGIPEDVVKKPRKKLYKLDMNTMAVLEEYDSVKEASEKLGISASTISNVLCQGKSAMKYLEAGNFRWAYSDQPNGKYSDVVSYEVKSKPDSNTTAYTLHLD